MKLRIAIYIAIICFFVHDFLIKPRKFKIEILPIIAITFFAGTDYFLTLDNRLRIGLFIVALLFTLSYLYSYSMDYKKERFKEKKRQRYKRAKEQIEMNDELLTVAANEGRKKSGKNSSIEITLDLDENKYKRVVQTSFLGEADYNQHVYENEAEVEDEQIDVRKELENQLDMFKMKSDRKK